MLKTFVEECGANIEQVLIHFFTLSIVIVLDPHGVILRANTSGLSLYVYRTEASVTY